MDQLQSSENRDPSLPEPPVQPVAQRGRYILAGALAFAAGLAAWTMASRFGDRNDPAPNPPLVDEAQMPSAVARAIGQARDAVMARPRSSEAWGRYGMCLYAHEYVAAARTCFEQAERLNAKDYRWPYLQGICVTFSDPQRGLACFERSAGLRPDLDFIRLRTAELAIDLNQRNQASSHLDAVLRVSPHDARANLAAARLAVLRGDYKLAATKADQSLRVAPDIRATYELLAKIAFQQKDVAAAKKNLESMQRATRTNDWPDPLIKEMMQMRRDLTWELFQAQNEWDNGRTNMAMERLNRLMGEYPESVELRIEWVRALQSLENTTEAVKAVEEGLRLNPNSARLLRMRGLLHFNQDEKALAAKWFRQAIRLKPDYGLRGIILGNVFWILATSPEHSGNSEKPIASNPTCRACTTTWSD